MILKENNNVEITGELNSSYKMNISASALSKVINIVTNKAYSDSLGSAIREGISNSLDSMTESGNKGFAQINLFKKEEFYNSNYVLQFVDTGLGLDLASFQKYIMGIGESTKSNNPNLLGGYGMGSKIPLGVDGVSSFHYICRKDGIERKILIFESNPVPDMNMIYEKPTDEPNGVIVEIEIGSSKFHKVISSIKEQCSYFENIYFNVPGIDNTYNIVKYPDFQWNTLNDFDEMHISLKGVKYDIDWKILEIPKLEIPIALRFDDYEDVKPIFTREQIEWNPETIVAVKNKIKTVADYLVSKYNESVQVEFNSVFDAWTYIISTKSVTLSDVTYTINELLEYSDIKPLPIKVKGLVYKTAEYYKGKFNFEDNYHVLYSSNYSGNRYNKTGYIRNADVTENKKIFLINYSFAGLVRNYLDQDSPKYIVQEKFIKKNLEHYINKLGLYDYDTKEWRARIVEFQTQMNLIYDSIITDKRNIREDVDYITWKEKNKHIYAYSNTYVALNKQVGEVILHEAKATTRNGIGYKFEKKTFPIGTLHQKPYQSLIFSTKEKELAATYANLSPKLHVYLCGDRDLKQINQKNHMIFAKITSINKPRQFKRIATSILYSRLLDNVKVIQSNMEDLFENEFNFELKQIDILKKYVKENPVNFTNDLSNEIFNKAQELNDFDFKFWDSYLKVKEIKDNLYFLRFITVKDKWGNNSEEALKLVNRLLLLNKKKNPEFFTNFSVTYTPEVMSEELEEYIELEEIDLQAQEEVYV